MPVDPSLPVPSWPMVLGIAQRTKGELDHARSMQADEHARMRPVALTLNLLVSAVIAGTLAPAVPAGLLGLWLAAVAVLVGAALWSGRTDARTTRAPRITLTRSTVNAAALGALWAVPPALFSRWGGTSELVVLAMLVPGVMGGAAFLLSAAPLAAVLFLVMVGLGGVGLMLNLGAPLLALSMVLLTVLMVYASLHHARALMQRRGVEQVLAEKDAVVSLLLREFDEGADWLWRTDAAKTLTSVSHRLARQLGRPPEALEGRPLLELLAGDGWRNGNVAGPLRDLADRLRAREAFADRHVPVDAKGETRWWSLSAVPRHDEAGRFVGFQGMASDITERRRSAERVERLARYDSLTGLANRRQVLEVLSDSLIRAHRDQGRTALMIIDLDRFKQVNDTLGHPLGDRLLREVADRLVDLCGEFAVPGRLGGDEFALVVPDASDADRVEQLADRIIAGLSAAYEIDGHQLFIGASIGSACAPRDGRSSDTLVRNADLALYRAKDDGRGLHRRYEQRLSHRAEERRAIEVALRDALEKEQFHLVYQPILTAADGRIEGFEAYLRWSHPELGEMTAERFVPIAEEARLIGRIGDWVIRTACQEAARWPDPIRLALNLSAEQLHDPHLATTLVSALSSSGLSPGRLELEVAEAVFLRPGGRMQAVLDRLHGVGVRVALSRFGTGYASLGYLRSARFSSIKLDRSFVSGAARDATDSLAMIRAVVAMADGLGMTVTAEGTETEREYELVRRLGCGRVQGFLFGHPMPAAEARALAGAASARKAA